MPLSSFERRAGIALLAWAAYLAFANVAWLRVQLSAHPPNWDRALYLYLSVRYLNAYRDGGLGALAAEFVQRSTTVAPLFPLSTLVSYLAFGESRLVAHATTCLYLLVLLAATYALGRRLYNPATGLLAAFVVSSSAGITLASRDYMLDLPAAALATAAVALLVLSDFGRRLRAALGFGILLGLSVLTKTMAGVFLVGPLAEALWRIRRDPQRASLALGLLAALVIASTWWGPNHAAALEYLWSYGFSGAAQPFAAGGESLLTLRNISYYPMALVNEGVGPIVAAQLIAAGLLLLRLRLRGRALPFGDAFLLRWLGISLAILSAVPNKSGARYSLGLLPPLALILAGAVAKLESRGGRRLAALAVLLAGLHSHAALTYDIGLPRLYYHLSTGLVAARPVAAPRSGGAGDVENPWPVRELLALATAEAQRERAELGRRASTSPASLLRAAELPPAQLVREAYLRLLKRPPDPAGLAAYVGELERGSLTPEGLVRAIADSNEFRTRPARVLVVTNHPFLNASVLRYYAERARLPLAFEHPERSLPPLAVADLYDLALLKRGGDQGPGHTTLLLPPLEHQIRRQGSSWRPLPNRLTCPDGAVVEVFASGPA